MKSVHSVALIVAGAVGLTACLPGLAAKPDSGRTLMITLTGAAEGPGLGDPDGSGTAELRIDPVQGRICYILTVEGIAPAKLSHIHKSKVEESGGPIVVHLEPPSDGESEDCMPIDPAVAQSILRTPSDYYVNVHNDEHPGGAVRGQLG